MDGNNLEVVYLVKIRVQQHLRYLSTVVTVEQEWHAGV